MPAPLVIPYCGAGNAEGGNGPPGIGCGCVIPGMLYAGLGGGGYPPDGSCSETGNEKPLGAPGAGHIPGPCMNPSEIIAPASGGGTWKSLPHTGHRIIWPTVDSSPCKMWPWGQQN